MNSPTRPVDCCRALRYRSRPGLRVVDATSNQSLIGSVRRIRCLPTVTIASLLAAATAAPTAARFADSLTVRHAGGSVYMIEGAGDIIGVSIGPDGLLLVDNGFPETVDAPHRVGKVGRNFTALRCEHSLAPHGGK